MVWRTNFDRHMSDYVLATLERHTNNGIFADSPAPANSNSKDVRASQSSMRSASSPRRPSTSAATTAQPPSPARLPAQQSARQVTASAPQQQPASDHFSVQDTYDVEVSAKSLHISTVCSL